MEVKLTKQEVRDAATRYLDTVDLGALGEEMDVSYVYLRQVQRQHSFPPRWLLERIGIYVEERREVTVQFLRRIAESDEDSGELD